MTNGLVSYVGLEARVRADHPLRVIRELANAALGDLSVEFDRLSTDFGRPSIAPEKLLRAAPATDLMTKLDVIGLDFTPRLDLRVVFGLRSKYSRVAGAHGQGPGVNSFITGNMGELLPRAQNRA